MEALKMAVALVLVVLLMFLFVVSEACKYRPSPNLRRRFWYCFNGIPAHAVVAQTSALRPPRVDL
jgi:hypothetical protein